MQNKKQYDSISSDYTAMVKTDPQKRFVQYPSALKLLGNISGLRILDVGCGSGAFAKELATRGASVVGYDISPEQIATAKKEKLQNIEFIVSNPEEFTTDKNFDKAVSVLVLHYAQDREYLKNFFSSTYKALKKGGRFVCILCNPKFKRLGVNLYNRCFKKIGNERMVVDFLDRSQEISCSAEYSDFSSEDYEKAAISGGFSRFEWRSLKPTMEGLKEMGKDYWKGFEEDCPYVGFIAYK